MPQITRGFDILEVLCPDQNYPLSVICESPNSTISWSFDTSVIGGIVTFSDPSGENTDISVSQEGSYDITVCCRYDVSGEATGVPPESTPGLNCPIGMVAGTTGSATVTGCAGALLTWSSSSPDLIVTPQPNGQAILTASITASGQATVTVECDDNGNITSFDCPINLVTPEENELLVCESTPPLVVAFETCGTICNCETITLNFDCEERDDCDTQIVTVTVKDCSQPDPEPCPEITPLLLKNG